MQYYVLANKITDIMQQKGITDEDMYLHCFAYGDELRVLMDNGGGPTRNSFLVAKLSQVLDCPSYDFAKRKSEVGDDSDDLKVHEALYSAPLDYDISHFH